jgi:putative intracellular protease/amidase
MFDLAIDPDIKTLIAAFWEAGKPVSAVCHGRGT